MIVVVKGKGSSAKGVEGLGGGEFRGAQACCHGGGDDGGDTVAGR